MRKLGRKEKEQGYIYFKKCFYYISVLSLTAILVKPESRRNAEKYWILIYFFLSKRSKSLFFYTNEAERNRYPPSFSAEET